MVAPAADHARKFRFGVLAKAPRARSEWEELARRAEALGYSTLLVSDHMGAQIAPFPALVAAAAATDRLRVGTLVANSDFRHPLLVAREAATVDLLSDGRLELGLGSGWRRRDYGESGIRWDRGRVRAERFEEAVAIIRRAQVVGRFSFDGSWYSLRDAEGGPVPVQDPLPLLIGAGSPRMLDFAARSAQIVSITRSMVAGPSAAAAARDATAAATDEKIARVRTAAGDNYQRLEIHILVTLVELGAQAHEAARAFAAAHDLTVDEVLDTPQHLLGSTQTAIEQLQARREQFDLSYIAVDEQRFDAFAPVVSALTGT